jgi:hypothetical protein
VDKALGDLVREQIPAHNPNKQAGVSQLVIKAGQVIHCSFIIPKSTVAPSTGFGASKTNSSLWPRKPDIYQKVIKISLVNPLP